MCSWSSITMVKPSARTRRGGACVGVIMMRYKRLDLGLAVQEIKPCVHQLSLSLQATFAS